MKSPPPPQPPSHFLLFTGNMSQQLCHYLFRFLLLFIVQLLLLFVYRFVFDILFLFSFFSSLIFISNALPIFLLLSAACPLSHFILISQAKYSKTVFVKRAMFYATNVCIAHVVVAAAAFYLIYFIYNTFNILLM